MSKILHKKLSYKIMGACYDVYNEIGYGHREKYYHRALARAFDGLGLEYKRERQVDLTFNGKKIGKQFLDFLVEGKVVLEVKTYAYVKKNKTNYKQTLGYLKATGLHLAILVYFTKDGVKYKRIVN